MNRDAALRKILACLRLSKSSNPNEAAAALRQARVLMEKYGLDENDALAAEIRDELAGTGYRGGMVPKSIVALSVVVADCYRCKGTIVVDRWQGKTSVRFFGAGADALVAAYAFTVLLRQLRAAKAKHTARIRKRANKERRGEEFAAGWIRAVMVLLPQDTPQGDMLLSIDRAIAARVGKTEPTSGKEIGKHGRANDNDFYKGHAAGKNAYLRNGVAGAAQKRLELQ